MTLRLKPTSNLYPTMCKVRDIGISKTIHILRCALGPLRQVQVWDVFDRLVFL